MGRHFIASTRVIAVLTLVSRVLGLARDSFLGYYFGTSSLASAFRIGFMVPNLARRLFGEGALSAAVIPVLTASLRDNGEEESRRVVGSVLTWLTVVLTLIVLAVELVVLAWDLLRPDMALTLTAVLTPYMVMVCVVAVAGGVLNVRGRFAAPAAAPILLNIAIIGACIVGGRVLHLESAPLMYLVCGGVLTAGLVQIIWMALALKAAGFFPILHRPWKHPAVRTIVTFMGPMVLGLSAVQINTLADVLIAYLFIVVDGERVGPAVLGYAQELYQLPLGVFGIAIATAIFPVLSQRAAAGDYAGLSQTLISGLRLCMFIALPATAGLIFVAEPLVAALFERGEFTTASTQRVAGTLVCYAFGLPAYFAQHVIARTFYALHDSKAPARTALVMVFVNLACNLALVVPLQERGLALSTAGCAVVQVVWLGRKLSQRVPQIPWSMLWRGAQQTVAATGVMGIVLAASVVYGWVPGPVIPRVVVMVVVGASAFGVAARVMRIEELGTLLSRGRGH